MSQHNTRTTEDPMEGKKMTSNSEVQGHKLAYSVPEVAEMLGISRASAYTYVRTGVIQSVTLGGRIIIPRKAITDLLELEEAS